MLIIGSLWYAVSVFGMCEMVLDVVLEIWLQRVGRGVELFVPPQAGAQVNKGYANFNVVQRSAVDSLLNCPDKICNRF